jgi:integrase
MSDDVTATTENLKAQFDAARFAGDYARMAEIGPRLWPEPAENRIAPEASPKPLGIAQGPPEPKASTAALYRGILEAAVLPALGGRAVTEVTRADVAALHHRLRRTPTHANRTLEVISVMMTCAERWGLRPDGTNPCRHVERFREQTRQRYLSTEEFQRLGAALAAAARGPVLVRGEPVRLSPMALAAIGLLIFTGARRSEILTLKWEHVDLERGVLTLPTSKTGFKVVMLNAPAIAGLTSLPRVEGNPYVLPGGREGRHLVNVSDTWYAVRALAGLKDVRLHDLRHSLASIGAGAGLSLPIIGADCSATASRRRPRAMPTWRRTR